MRLLAGGRDRMFWRKELGQPQPSSSEPQTHPEVTVVHKLRGGYCGPGVGHFVLKELTAWGPRLWAFPKNLISGSVSGTERVGEAGGQSLSRQLGLRNEVL